jgi:membrane protein DedA with SNARE-associated domain
LSALVSFLTGLSHWQIDAVVLLMLWEGAIFTVFPEETVLIGLGVLTHMGKIHFLEAVVVAQVGLIPADAALWFFGRGVGASIVRIPLIQGIVTRAVATNRSLASLQNHGAKLIFFTRFVPFLRAPVYFASGAARIRISRFLLADWLGSCLHAPLLVWLGCRLSASSRTPADAYQSLLGIGILMLAVGLLVFVIQRGFKRPSRTAPYCP